MTGLRIEALAAHDRKAFSCEVEPLDRYLREQASQDVRRRVSNCYVAVDTAGAIAGYYTLAATSLAVTELPAETVRRLPRYGLMPAGLIGRLAVDAGLRGQGLGGAMIVDAARRAARAEAAIYALVVDAKDQAAVGFYEHLGFQRFQSRPATLFVPVATVLQA